MVSSSKIILGTVLPAEMRILLAIGTMLLAEDWADRRVTWLKSLDIITALLGLRDPGTSVNSECLSSE